MMHDNGPTAGETPATTAMEAALAELKPRRNAGFADHVRRRMRDEWLGQPSPTDMVKISLERYVRIERLNATVLGVVVGLFFGVCLGVAGTLILVRTIGDSQAPEPRRVYVLPRSYAETLLEDPNALTPLERSLLEHYQEPSDEHE